MKEGYIKQEDRKKILFICDDIRMHSGVATMAREIVTGTAHRYNWVNVAAAIKHPDAGKRLDLSNDTNKVAGISDASITLYPNDGYGNADLIRQLIKIEKPDAIMLFTDPRYFVWLFQIEDEIRKQMPIFYYNIWDDSPAPLWNESFYESCDLLMAISKQTKNLNEIVLGSKKESKILSYVPHGINEDQFFPITQEYEKYDDFKSFKNNVLGGNEYDFIAFWNSRNIHRKHPSDVILAFNQFVSKLPKDKAKRCALVMHTEPVDQNGTDLPAVKDLVCDPEYCNVIFSTSKLSPDHMNYLYNMADITMLISSNEGWGLSLTESLLTGTMILANVTGGMQDQMRFEDEDGKWIEFNDKFLSNHFGTYKKCGEWALPIFPSNISLAGSVPTPYIFDDRADFRDVAEQLENAYNMGVEERIEKGIAGREWATGDEAGFTAKIMCKRMIKDMDDSFDNFKPRASYTLTKIVEKQRKAIRHPLTY
jgi:hypothetical protein